MKSPPKQGNKPDDDKEDKQKRKGGKGGKKGGSSRDKNTNSKDETSTTSKQGVQVCYSPQRTIVYLCLTRYYRHDSRESFSKEDGRMRRA